VSLSMSRTISARSPVARSSRIIRGRRRRATQPPNKKSRRHRNRSQLVDVNPDARLPPAPVRRLVCLVGTNPGRRTMSGFCGAVEGGGGGGGGGTWRPPPKTNTMRFRSANPSRPRHRERACWSRIGGTNTTSIFRGLRRHTRGRRSSPMGDGSGRAQTVTRVKGGAGSDSTARHARRDSRRRARARTPRFSPSETIAWATVMV
jgi:hypothetical protein